MTDPGDILQTLETRTVHVSLRRDGIILQRMLLVKRQTMQDARDNLAAFNTLAAGTPHPMLLDARHPVTIDAGVSPSRLTTRSPPPTSPHSSSPSSTPPHWRVRCPAVALASFRRPVRLRSRRR